LKVEKNRSYPPWQRLNTEGVGPSAGDNFTPGLHRFHYVLPVSVFFNDSSNSQDVGTFNISLVLVSTALQ
jgi:hypothetical protein